MFLKLKIDLAKVATTAYALMGIFTYIHERQPNYLFLVSLLVIAIIVNLKKKPLE